MAKLLYHKIMKGRGRSTVIKAAGSIIINRKAFDENDEVNILKKPVSVEDMPDSIKDDRVSLPDSDRFVLKKRPENNPVRKININIRLIFFISMSPFSSVIKYAFQ